MTRPYVLFVEDDPLVARATRRQLAQHCEVELVATRVEALARTAQRRPDVVLCDLRLAEETAVRLLEELRLAHPTLRCVIYSAQRVEDVRPLLERGLVDDWVEKPGLLGPLLKALGIQP